MEFLWCQKLTKYLCCLNYQSSFGAWTYPETRENEELFCQKVLSARFSVGFLSERSMNFLSETETEVSETSF